MQPTCEIDLFWKALVNSVVVGSPSQAADAGVREVKGDKMLSETQQMGRLHYKVFGPDEAQAGLPVLCFLHGNGEHAGNMPIEQALAMHGPLKDDDLTRAALAGRFWVVVPQLAAPGGNVWGAYADDVVAIVESVGRVYGADPQRTYLTGFSYGGNGVFTVAARRPSPWAALLSVDPPLKPLPRTQHPLWLALGDRARTEAAALQRLGFAAANEVDNSADHIFIDYGEGHTETATLTYRDERVYNWLLSRCLT